jgi:TolB-like protein/Tfp pilus assembly protein PilF
LAAIFIIFLSSIVFIVWKPFGEEKLPKDKSIAILPFINDSPEESEMYFINGTMEAILNNLCKINDLRVISRTTVEQYRNHPQPIPEIAKKMGVNYILEGSGQKYGKRMHLSVTLLDAANDQHIWTEEYDLEINQIEDLFDLQNEIARMVAAEIHAEVSPEEMRRMEKIPTTSEMAYEFFLKGIELYAEYYTKFFAGGGSSDLLTSAENMFRYALEYDPAFAHPYRYIAALYSTRILQTQSKKEYWDTIRINVERALSCDPEDAASYQLLGNYYRNQGNWDKAMEYFATALRFNPNSRDVYATIGLMYAEKSDLVNALENLHTSLSYPHPAENYINVTQTFLLVYLWAGFKEQYDRVAELKLEYSGDSAMYYCDLATAEYWIDDYREKALELLEKSYRIDSTALGTLNLLGEVCLNDGQYARSLEYFQEYITRMNELDRVNIYGTHNIGLAYWLNGDKEKAEHYFDLQISYCRDFLSGVRDSHGTLASIYAFRGDRDQAYKHLREFNDQSRMRIYVKNGYSEDNPYFISLLGDPEYQSIRAEIVAKYEAEHERVRQWLEENDIL